MQTDLIVWGAMGVFALFIFFKMKKSFFKRKRREDEPKIHSKQYWKDALNQLKEPEKRKEIIKICGKTFLMRIQILQIRCLVLMKNQKRRKEKMTRITGKNGSFSNWCFNIIFLLAGHTGWSDNFSCLDILARKEMAVPRLQ